MIDPETRQAVIYSMIQQGVDGYANPNPPLVVDSLTPCVVRSEATTVVRSGYVVIRAASLSREVDSPGVAELRAQIRLGVVEGLEPLRIAVSSVEKAFKRLSKVARKKRGVGRAK